MSYDDDIDAIPSLCDSCFGKLKKATPTHGIGWRVQTFKCVACKHEYCPHLEGVEFSRICIDCTNQKSSERTTDAK